MYCPECGGKVIDGICKDCKKEISKELLSLSQETETFKKDKIVFLLLYIMWPIGAFMSTEDKKLKQYHKNQGFTLFLVELLTVASFFIPTIGKFVGIVLSVCVALLIYKGIMNVIHGERSKLPVIGDFTFLKD